jgi:hypothetical protein
VTIRELQGRVSLLTFQLDKATRATAHFEAQVEELRKSGAAAGQSVLEGSQVTPQLKVYLEELEGRVGVLLTKNQELEHSLKDKVRHSTALCSTRGTDKCSYLLTQHEGSEPHNRLMRSSGL